MVYFIEYAKVSPAILDMIITTACPNAYTMSYPVEDADDMFELAVCFWEDATNLDLCKVERTLAPYV